MTDQDALFKTGMGNWKFLALSVDEIREAATHWANSLQGVTKPWLVWNVDANWCLIQQKLVASVGWTPIVGFDPRVGAPPIIPEAILVDFNAHLHLPVMFPHFPLEFTFLFADRLAFWHSDLLVRKEKMQALANQFESLDDGVLCATFSGNAIRRALHKTFLPDKARYWELIGCTTRSASKSQFDHGCGWWMNFVNHVNFSGDASRNFYWDHGAGILYWEKYCHGRVIPIYAKTIDEGHFSQTRLRQYQRVSPNNHRRNLHLDLNHNFTVSDCAKLLGLEEFV